MKSKVLVRGAFLIAVAVILQSVRVILPLPPLLTTFIVGTLVNMMLTLTFRLNGFTAAGVLSVLLPLFAYLQGQLLLPFLIPVVIAGNLLFVLCVKHFTGGIKGVLLPALAKALIMGGAAYLALLFLQINNAAFKNAILFAMTAPQFITGISGIKAADKMLQIFKNKI